MLRRIPIRPRALGAAALLLLALGGCGRSDDTTDQPGIGTDEQQRLDDAANSLDVNASQDGGQDASGIQPENGS